MVGFWEVPREAYFADKDWISASMLEDFKANRYEFFSKHVLKEPQEGEEKHHFTFGKAFHSAILEPEKFEAEVVVSPKFDKRKPAEKQASIEFHASNAGKVVIDKDDHEMLLRMQDSVFRNADAREWLSLPGRTEQPVRWVQDSGLQAKCMFDRLVVDGAVIDLKSSACGTPRAWARDAGLYGYHRRQAWYEDGRASLGLEGDFIFIVVSKEKYPRTFVARINPENVELGRNQNYEAALKYQSCLEMQRWVDDDDGVVEVNIPFYFLE